MPRRSSRLTVTVVALVLLATLGVSGRPLAVEAGTSPFTDIAGTTFEADIEWLFAEGITVGCTPTAYCPWASVTRGQMASFLVRMFKLTAGWDVDAFTDDDGTTHEEDINRLAASGITVGCTATTFCPIAPVRRGEMASFLSRAIPLTEGAGDNYFRDDDGTTHEADIDRAAAAGIASGCAVWRYCPTAVVTRGQMAGFLHRVEKPVTPPPHPAPSGPATLHVATTGSDSGNACLDKTSPCRTIARALEVAFDRDTISIGPGTFNEENLSIIHDLTIEGDPGGGTTIDASGGDRYRIFRIPPVKSPRNSPAGPQSDPHRTVALTRLTMTGGRAGAGGAIENDGTLTITDSTISGNTSYAGGGIYNNWGTLTITDSTISGNTSYAADGSGGGIASYYGSLTITNSTISGNTSSRGGGIAFHYDGTVTITNSTISGNTATSGVGGGIDTAGTLHLANTIVAGNSSGTGGQISGTNVSRLASIVRIPTGLTLADILDPAGLQDNGGLTQTIALTDSATNPARRKGDTATCASAPVNGLDQRGLPRTPPCDIGAYELQP